MRSRGFGLQTLGSRRPCFASHCFLAATFPLPPTPPAINPCPARILPVAPTPEALHPTAVPGSDSRDRKLYSMAAWRHDATAVRVEILLTRLPRVGPSPYCPTTVRPRAGLHNPFRIGGKDATAFNRVDDPFTPHPRAGTHFRLGFRQSKTRTKPAPVLQISTGSLAPFSTVSGS